VLVPPTVSVHVLLVTLWADVAVHPVAVTVPIVTVMPVDERKFVPRIVVDVAYALLLS
jgi:hypothetical protein